MSIFQKPSRHQFIVTACVLVWIFIVNVAAIAACRLVLKYNGRS